MIKHTEGDWSFSLSPNFKFRVGERVDIEVKSKDVKDDRTYGYGCDGRFICNLQDGEYNNYKNLEELLANARLIAAAPKLLKACKQAASALKVYHNSKDGQPAAEALLRIEQTIAEVEGL